MYIYIYTHMQRLLCFLFSVLFYLRTILAGELREVLGFMVSADDDVRYTMWYPAGVRPVIMRETNRVCLHINFQGPASRRQEIYRCWNTVSMFGKPLERWFPSWYCQLILPTFFGMDMIFRVWGVMFHTIRMMVLCILCFRDGLRVMFPFGLPCWQWVFVPRHEQLNQEF